MAGFIRLLEDGSILITEAGAERVSEDFIPDVVVQLSSPSSTATGGGSRRRRRIKARLVAHITLSQPMAYVEARGDVKERIAVRACFEAPRHTVSAAVRQQLAGTAVAWTRRATATIAAHQDLDAWTARRQSEDDELLQLLQIVDAHQLTTL